MKDDPQHTTSALDAYAEYENRITRRHLEVGCLLVMVLMPVGVILDHFVYPEQTWPFLRLRLICTLLEGVVLLSLRARPTERIHRALGLIVALLPVVFICWMIYATDGPRSPYYAGINLILLAIAFIMRWSVDLSVLASGLVLLLYLGACLLRGPVPPDERGIFANNLYFLALTSVIVVVGSQLHRALRVREFALRYELDQNKRVLEQTNQKLDTQNKELADTIQKLTEAELQLVQQEKMASLGVMSAGIIHEINNPLNYATTGLYTLRKQGRQLATQQQADFEEVLNDVEEGVARVKDIISDLRTFSHPETESRDQVAVTEVVGSALRFLSGEWKSKVNIEQHLVEHQTIWANQNKLHHVVVNLLQNSLDALKSKPFQGEMPTIRIEGRVENGWSRLIIHDNGPGIETQNLDKIFDPFFTTKEVGQGIGLGLSICYRIVRDYDGRISVRTERGKFCEFTLEFPARAEP